MQINPPYDGSEPCPGCQLEPRGIAATLHNFLTRCELSEDKTKGWICEGNAWSKLDDLKRGISFDFKLTVPHPDVEELVAAASAMVTACEGLTYEGATGTIRWTPRTADAVFALIPRVAKAVDGYARISNAHFHDNHHSQGVDNILRASRGWSFRPFTAPKTLDMGYDYTVEEVEPADANLQHGVCGVALKVHDTFLDNIRDHGTPDRPFYDKVYCPRCKDNTPFAQWTVQLFHLPLTGAVG